MWYSFAPFAPFAPFIDQPLNTASGPVETLTFLVDVALCTLAWLVQGIMYPTLKQIGTERFSTYHTWYTRRITWFVGPLMSLQVILHAYQVTRVDVGTTVVFAALGVMATWLITGISAVPIHARLALDGFDEPLVDRLLRVNLVRALVWTAIVLAWIPGFQP